jgi:uncharacterized protein YkwD/chitodextrinase
MLARDANIAGVSCVYSSSGVPYWTYEPGCSPDFCGQSYPPPPAPPAPNPPPPDPTPAPPGAPTLDSEESAFLALINNYRTQNGAVALQVSVALENASKWMSNDMATKNYASHTDSLGRTPGARLAAFGYTYSPWGENIAGGYGDAQSAFNQWLNACDPDPSGSCTYAHRVNMLNPGFRVIGIGRAYSGSSNYGWYWATDFGGYIDQTMDPNSPPGVAAPAISFFYATPPAIMAGQSTTLSWGVSGANAIAIDNGVGDVTNASSKPVSPGGTTIYRLTATNSAGSATAVVTVTVTPASDVQAPSAPTLLSAVAQSTTRVNLTWTASVDNVGVAGYQILRNGSVLTSVSGSARSHSDTGAGAGTTYTYQVKAFDAAGNYSGASNGIQVTTPAAPVVLTCPGPATDAFTGCYYNNITLSGNPVLARTDSQINFDWGYGSPDASVTRDGFSVRWQGNFTFTQGEYTFSALVSDGMRLYIDGALVLDRWRDQSVHGYAIRRTLSPGTHLITVEYYERTGWPIAHLWWGNNSPGGQAGSDTQAPSAPVLSSAVVISATQVDLAWGGSTDNVGVAGYQILRNGAVLTSLSTAARSYSDTGASAGTTYTYSVRAYDAASNFSAPSNGIQVTTPAAPVSLGCPGPSTNAFTGCYYNNTNLSGSPVFTRTDTQIDFDWTYKQPHRSVSPDNFSVRWQGYFPFTYGEYTFSALVSDGIRLYIDGDLVLDQWRNQPATTYSVRRALTYGNHLITVEYYERTGWPSVRLSWQKN